MADCDKFRYDRILVTEYSQIVAGGKTLLESWLKAKTAMV